MDTSLWMANTPGHWATVSSILIWKISCDILSPKGTCRSLYLLRWVLNVVRSGFLWQMHPKRRPCYHPPWKIWWLLWGHGLSPQGSETCGSHRWWLSSSPWGQGISSTCCFAFLGYVRLLTQGVGSVYLVMIPCHTISTSSFLISSLYSMGTFCLLCWTGGTGGSVLMLYWPFISLMQWKTVGKQCLKIPGAVMDTEPGSK